MLKKYGWIALFAAFLLVFWFGQQSASQNPDASAPVVEQPRPDIQSPPSPVSPTHDDLAQETNSLPDHLPAEARTTLDLILKGGPFPYRQDGVVFQNREKRLPVQPRGYYHEYTVETPGLSHRGARRIITGGNPVVTYYYTDDHYDSFRELEVQP